MDKDIKAIKAELLEPFDPFDIEWRIQKAGENNGKKWAMVLAYVTNRAIMERLDDVFGIDGWENVFNPMADGGIICGIKANVNGVERTKYDGADKTAIEATKGGLSNAMKRAGVQWGIGRYLYRLDTTFVTLETGAMPKAGGDYIPAFVKDLGGRHYFTRPQLPKFALPRELQGEEDQSKKAD